MEPPGILKRNEHGEVVIYLDAIPDSNFKSLFKSMVSIQQNWTMWASVNLSTYYET